VGKISRPPRGSVGCSASAVGASLPLGIALAVGVGLEALGLEADGDAVGEDDGFDAVEALGGVTVTWAQPAARTRATEESNKRGRSGTTNHPTPHQPVD
jgi:hypothetical protein